MAGVDKIKEKDSSNYRDERRDGCWPQHSNITQKEQTVPVVLMTSFKNKEDCD